MRTIGRRIPARRAALRAALLLVAVLATGCRAPQESAGDTFVTRTRVSRVTGTAADTPVSESESTLPGQPCAHVWRPAERETHAYVDATGEIAMAALCTPIRCERCGAVRHECVPRRRR